MIKTLTLGPEYDEALQNALLSVLQEMGAKMGKASWGVAGSQEIVSRRATVRGYKVYLVGETYIGLTLKGDDSVVDEIATRTLERCHQS